MTATLSRRERVARTLACQETDRVPLYDLLRNDAAFAHFAGEPLPPLASDPATGAALHRLACRATGAFLDMTRSPGFGPVQETETTDGWGFVWHHAPFEKTSWIARRPFDDEPGALRFLETCAAHWRQEATHIRADAKAYRERYHRGFVDTQALLGDATNLLAQHGTGLDDINHRLGLELFSYILADQPAAIAEALEAYTAMNIAVCHAVADPVLSPAVLTYGDIACKDRLMYPLDFLRREFFPRLARLNAAWHEHGLLCLFHSDGYLMDVLDDLVAAGSDGLNPIETVAGMDLRRVRERCPRLLLAGGIDMSQLLSRGTPDQVREVCRQAIRDAYPGYLMGSTTESDNSCRLENLLAMRDVALEGVP